MKYYIRGTHYLSQGGFEVEEIRSLILRRRLQILVHSYIYYRLATSLVSDQQWQEWANELVVLQRDYPQICERVDYHETFKGFDGTTGFNLCEERGIGVVNKAKQLVAYHEKYKSKEKEKEYGRERKDFSHRVVRIKF